MVWSEIVPLFHQKSTTTPVKASSLTIPFAWSVATFTSGKAATTATQMIRPFRAETERYGHYSVAGGMFMTTRSSGVPSALVPTCTAWVAVTPINGTVSPDQSSRCGA